MIILGLTGSVGMGKSEAVRGFVSMGLPVFEADSEVHRLLSEDPETIAEVSRLFPGCIVDGCIDRSFLAGLVFESDISLDLLEATLHPRIKIATERFLRFVKGSVFPLAVVEMPLLFETGSDCDCDVVLVVTSPKELQKKRVLARPGMTQKQFAFLLKRQLSDEEKRDKADFVIETNKSRSELLLNLEKIVKILVPTVSAQI